MGRPLSVHWALAGADGGIRIRNGKVVVVCGLNPEYRLSASARKTWTRQRAYVTCCRCCPELATRDLDPAAA